MTLLKFKLDVRRPPKIHLARRNIRIVGYTRYLDVTLQAGLKHDMFAGEICAKSFNIFAVFYGLTGASWGFDTLNIKTFYNKEVFCPIISYADSHWAPYIN